MRGVEVQPLYSAVVLALYSRRKAPDAHRVGGGESAMSRQDSVKRKQVLSGIKHRLHSH